MRRLLCEYVHPENLPVLPKPIKIAVDANMLARPSRGQSLFPGNAHFAVGADRCIGKLWTPVVAASGKVNAVVVY